MSTATLMHPTVQTAGGVGVATLLRLRLRVDRAAILGWALGTIGLFAMVVAAVHNLYPTADLQSGYAQALGGNAALEAINGTAYGADTLGGIIANEWAFIGMVAVPLLAVSLVARGTRRDEENGRLELLRSRGVGPVAPVVSSSLVAAGALVAVALAMMVLLAVAGVPTGPAVLFAASYLGLGVLWTAMSLVAAQLVRRSRGVWVVGGAVLVASYLLRAVGVVRGTRVQWASPLVWVQETRAFADDARVWPMAVPFLTAAVLAVLAARLASGRDIGAGVLASLPGPDRASTFLGSTWGRSVRTALPSTAGWSAVVVVVGVIFGGLSREMSSALAANAGAADVFGGQGADAVDGYLAFTIVTVTLIACAAAVHGVTHLRASEVAGLAESELARPVARVHWALAGVVVPLVAALVIALLGGLATGLSAAASLHDPARAATLTGAALGYAPAVAVCAAVPLLLFGLLPRAQAAAWLVVVWSGVVAVLGSSLDLADWARGLSPVDRLGSLPVDAYDAAAAWGLIALAVALGIVGVTAFRRRDVPS